LFCNTKEGNMIYVREGCIIHLSSFDMCDAAEAFVGKGLFGKKVAYHAKGRSGIISIPRCRLTVIVRETTAEEEAEIARLKVHNFKKLNKRQRQLVPHKLIETSPIWNRRGTKGNHRSSELVPSH